MPQIRKREVALRDLIQHYADALRRRGLEAAEQLLDVLHQNITRLSEQPLRGMPMPSAPAVLHGLRRWPVRGCDDLMIVYRPRAEGVEIIRVLVGCGELDAAAGPHRRS